MSQYTPTTEIVRSHFSASADEYGTRDGIDLTMEEAETAFDRWHAEQLRRAQARALEEAAEAWENGTVDYFEIKHSSDAPLGWSDESVADAIMSSGPVMDWLRKRAKQIKDQQ